jgi:antirestriction protein
MGDRALSDAIRIEEELTMTTLDISADIIDVCDIIDRFEELESAADGLPDAEERTALAEILDELKGNGGDTQWRGDWYPSHLIADSHFTEYTREMLADCGTIPSDLPAWVEIDWDATARNVRSDYTAIEMDNDTYWYR